MSATQEAHSTSSGANSRLQQPPPAPSTSTLAERAQLTEIERLSTLERNGELFADSNPREYQLAQHATWWGKPLDPSAFWKGRTVWLDERARASALRHGREWPPIPFKDPRLPDYPNDDGIDWTWASPDGPNIHYAGSSTERAFWTGFAREHPRPPSDLEAKQYELARHACESSASGQTVKLDPGDLNRLSAAVSPYMDQCIKSGYPPEAFSPNALFWAYVIGQRNLYSQSILPTHPVGSDSLGRLLSDNPLPPSYLIGTLNPDHLKQATQWKIEYLKRLRIEGTNETYIPAYLQAWGLSEQQVFNTGE